MPYFVYIFATCTSLEKETKLRIINPSHTNYHIGYSILWVSSKYVIVDKGSFQHVSITLRR